MIWFTFLLNLALTAFFVLFFFFKLNKKIRKLRRKVMPIIEGRTNNATLAELNGFFIKDKKLGKNSYACDYFAVASKETTVGKFCSIADNVTLGTTFHPTDRLSTHPFTYFDDRRLAGGKQIPFQYVKPVTVGNDVWIGKHVTVMDGITIGDGAVIGTNAVVTKDVPPYAIMVGVPARVLRYRFDEQTIKDLLRLKWWDLDDKVIAKLPFCDIPKCIKELKKIRGEKV